MLVSTLRWRDYFKVDSVLTETFPEEVFGKVGYIHGRDKEGRPVVYVSFAGYHDGKVLSFPFPRYNFYGGSNIHEVFSDVQRFLR